MMSSSLLAKFSTKCEYNIKPGNPVTALESVCFLGTTITQELKWEAALSFTFLWRFWLTSILPHMKFILTFSIKLVCCNQGHLPRGRSAAASHLNTSWPLPSWSQTVSVPIHPETPVHQDHNHPPQKQFLSPSNHSYFPRNLFPLLKLIKID